MARIAREGHDLVITHGNGPQVGLLALQGLAYKPDEIFPLDMLGAETEGMIGYLIEQELENALNHERTVATLLMQIRVDPDDPAFENPTKCVGPIHDKAKADEIAGRHGWPRLASLMTRLTFLRRAPARGLPPARRPIPSD